jgi:hypothetical protein
MPNVFLRASEAASDRGDVRRNGAAVRPSLLHGSIPVSVRTILVRKLLAGWEGKVVTQIFTSWNPLTSWLRQVERLRHAA